MTATISGTRIHGSTPRQQVAPVIGLALALATLTSVGCAGERPAALPIVDATSHRTPPAGEVVGFTNGYGSHAWLGLPFAAPPVGADRWRSPAPAAIWPGQREATAFGSPCAQLASPFAGVVDQEPGTPAGSEDCLYLNVYAPKRTPDSVPAGADRLPVMVWIHGGGNSIGHASFYDAGRLAVAQDLVVVTINYRLGPFGWFRHASLRDTARDAAEASGNFGTLDQIRALEWVRDNISAFGGDPENVTIFGESAGARDVLALVLSPMASGLFHRAISQSGSARELLLEDAEVLAGPPGDGLPNSSNEILSRLLVSAGRARDRSAAVALIADMPSSDIATFLRDTSWTDLLNAYVTDDMEGIPDVPNVFGDGTVIPAEPPLERLATPGSFNDVPVMFGTNRDETKIFMFASPRNTMQFLGFLPRLRDPDVYNASAAVSSLAWKLVGADAPAAAMREGGASDVYVYRWDWDEEPTLLGSDLAEMIGAAHGFEIPFIFGHFDLGPRANVAWTDENFAGRDELSRQMMSYWAAFARDGRPGRGTAGDAPEWTAWDPDGASKFLVLDTPAGGGLRMSSEQTDSDDIIALVSADPRLGSARCEVAGRTSETLQGIGLAPIRVDGCDAPDLARRP